MICYRHRFSNYVVGGFAVEGDVAFQYYVLDFERVSQHIAIPIV